MGRLMIGDEDRWSSVFPGMSVVGRVKIWMLVEWRRTQDEEEEEEEEGRSEMGEGGDLQD